VGARITQTLLLIPIIYETKLDNQVLSPMREDWGECETMEKYGGLCALRNMVLIGFSIHQSVKLGSIAQL
jgi:hypothetical protein